MKTLSLSRWSLLMVAVMGLAPGIGRAVNDLSQAKMIGRWSVTPTSFGDSSAVALNEKWAVSGFQNAAERGQGQEGAVQVFNSATSVWVRKILPPLPAAPGRVFGCAVAVNGDYAVIGAKGESGAKGAAFVYNLATGVLIRTLTVPSGSATDLFGCAVAMNSNLAFIGAQGVNGSRGRVYVFDYLTGTLQGQMDLGGLGSAFDQLGRSLACDGNMVLAGMPGLNSDKGGACLFDGATRTLVNILIPAGLVGGDQAGVTVAISRDKLYLGAFQRNSNKGSVFCGTRTGSAFTELTAPDGAPNYNFGSGLAGDAGMLLVGSVTATVGPLSATGAAYLFEANTPLSAPAFIRKITPNDATATFLFGNALALCGNVAMISADGDDTLATGVGILGTDAGAAYLFKPLVSPLGALKKVAAKGDSAPSSPDAFFNTMGDAFINSNGKVAFASTLSGPGSNGGTDTGVWSTISVFNTLKLAVKSRMPLSPQLAQSVGTPVINEDGVLMFPVLMKTGVGGITPANNKLFVQIDTLGVLDTKAQLGVTIGLLSFGITKLASHGELVQGNTSGQNIWVLGALLNNGATPVNDSSVLGVKGFTVEGFREGIDAIPGGGSFYGQMTGRMAVQLSRYAFSAATSGPAATNQVIVAKTLTTADTVLVARKGDIAPDAGGVATFSALLGETVGGNVATLFRATLAGGGVTPATNEGVWWQKASGAKEMVLHKGQLIDGKTVAKIISSWSLNATSDQGLCLVQFIGAGITPANDQALVLVQEDSTPASPKVQILLREGDPALGCTTGKIGTISRVEVDSYGSSYAVVATLAGAPAGTDLALYTGNTLVGNTTTQSALRRPYLFMRKGWQFDGQPGKVKSFSLPTTNMPASGVGATGRGRAISWNGRFAVTVEFDNGVRQIMKADQF